MATHSKLFQKSLAAVLVTFFLLSSLMVPVMAQGTGETVDLSKTQAKIVPVAFEGNDFDNNHNANAFRIEMAGKPTDGTAIIVSGLGPKRTGTFTVYVVSKMDTTYIDLWQAQNIEVKAIFVKGADAFNRYDYPAARPEDRYLSAPKKKNIPEISHITVVYAAAAGADSGSANAAAEASTATATTPTTTLATAKATTPTTTLATTTATTPTTTLATTTASSFSTESSGQDGRPRPSDLLELADEAPPFAGGHGSETSLAVQISSTSQNMTDPSMAAVDLGDDPIPQTGETAQTLAVGVIFLALAAALSAVVRRASRQNP